MSAVDTVSPAATAPTTDSQLVWAVRDGEDEAFEELFRRYQSRVRKFVARRVGDPGRAEDLTQDVFISALRRMRATDSEIAFKPWLFEIARNATIDLHRRTSRAEEVPVEGLELVGSGPPEAEVLARERLAHLRGAFGELNETQRRGLVMRELEGRSYREIGERLQLTRPAVESVLFRARRRLAKEYRAIRAKAAALLPFPAVGQGGSASMTVGEQAVTIVTAAALAVAGGVSIERADTRPAAPSEPPAGPAAVEPLQLLPDWGPPVPLSAPPPEARSRRSRPEKSTSRGSSRRAGDRTEQPAPAAAAPAEPPQDETASAPPPVGLTLKESADRPPALTVDSVAPPRLTAAIPAPRAQPEGGIAPVLDAVKELVRAG